MDGRLKYYLVLKQIHLISSIILAAFIFVFLITGIVVVNRNLFKIPPSVENNSKAPVDKRMNENPGEYADYLKERFGFKGRVFQQKEKNGNWIFQFNFQGENHKVTLTPAQDTLRIKSNTQKMSLLTVSEKLHHMRGFSGGWEYTAWAIFYDLTAVSLIIFSLTGILMWLKTKSRYPKGWWYLAAGVIIPLVIIYLFLLWR